MSKKKIKIAFLGFVEAYSPDPRNSTLPDKIQNKENVEFEKVVIGKEQIANQKKLTKNSDVIVVAVDLSKYTRITSSENFDFDLNHNAESLDNDIKSLGLENVKNKPIILVGTNLDALSVANQGKMTAADLIKRRLGEKYPNVHVAYVNSSTGLGVKKLEQDIIDATANPEKKKELFFGLFSQSSSSKSEKNPQLMEITSPVSDKERLDSTRNSFYETQHQLNGRERSFQHDLNTISHLKERISSTFDLVTDPVVKKELVNLYKQTLKLSPRSNETLFLIFSGNNNVKVYGDLGNKTYKFSDEETKKMVMRALSEQTDYPSLSISLNANRIKSLGEKAIAVTVANEIFIKEWENFLTSKGFSFERQQTAYHSPSSNNSHNVNFNPALNSSPSSVHQAHSSSSSHTSSNNSATTVAIQFNIFFPSLTYKFNDLSSKEKAVNILMNSQNPLIMENISNSYIGLFLNDNNSIVIPIDEQVETTVNSLLSNNGFVLQAVRRQPVIPSSHNVPSSNNSGINVPHSSVHTTNLNLNLNRNIPQQLPQQPLTFVERAPKPTETQNFSQNSGVGTLFQGWSEDKKNKFDKFMQEKGEDVYNSICDPILFAPMEEPVVLAGDGKTYDMLPIMQALEIKKQSPLTNEVLTGEQLNLLPDYSKRIQIQQFITQFEKTLGQQQEK